MIEILDFLQEHKKAVIAVAVMLLCFIVSGSVAGGFAKKTEAAADQLYEAENKVANVQDQLKQPKTKYKELDHGYQQSRVDRDVTKIIGLGTGNGNTNEWLSRFLTWNSGTEYNENRDWFVEKLGASNVFCSEIMRSYDTTLSITEKGAVNDPDNVRCSLNVDQTKKSVYVNAIDDNTGIYEYVIFAYYNGEAAFSNKSFKSMAGVQCYIVTVSVDADGNILPETFIVSAGPSGN